MHHDERGPVNFSRARSGPGRGKLYVGPEDATSPVRSPVIEVLAVPFGLRDGTPNVNAQGGREVRGGARALRRDARGDARRFPREQERGGRARIDRGAPVPDEPVEARTGGALLVPDEPVDCQQ